MLISNRPLYLQVRDVLAERIASGGLLPGAALPSEGDLAREIGVSTGTVRKALQIMESDRLVVRQQGRGTFVSDPMLDGARLTRLHCPDGVRIRGRVASTEIARGEADALERERLRLPAGAEVYRVRRVRCHGDKPFLVEEAVLPSDLFPGLDGKGSVAEHLSALARQFRILLGNAQERISLALAPAPVAKALGAAPHEPVVVLDRVVLAYDSRRPVEWRLAHSNLPGSYYLAELT